MVILPRDNESISSSICAGSLLQKKKESLNADLFHAHTLLFVAKGCQFMFLLPLLRSVAGDFNKRGVVFPDPKFHFQQILSLSI